jgi:chemotaxis protein MotB
MEIEEDPPMGIPEWVVTFGDMMSLLLTFFIMLVSLSEIKEEEKYQALVESLRQQFGYTKTISSLTPGDSTPRTSAFDPLATMGRAMKKNTAKGGVPDKSPVGEERTVRIVRSGDRTAIGSVIFFEPGSGLLTAQAKADLDLLAGELRGKPQRIEVRGHTSPQIAARATHYVEVIEMGQHRANAVFRYLTEEAGLRRQRIRVSSAGDAEPMYDSGDPAKLRLNARVEVFLTDETATAGESESRTEQQPESDSNGEVITNGS